jgi:predicted transcriptional regulator
MARVNIFLSDELLDAVDAGAAKARLGRSAFVTAALTRYLDEKKREREEDAVRRKMEAASRGIDQLASKLGNWDAVATIRRFRDARVPAVAEPRARYRTNRKRKSRA